LSVVSFPKEEEYRLKDQLLRASRSVPANIAEGYGRFHYHENIQFCRQARGSAYEIVDHLICAKDEGFIDQKRVTSLRKEITVCIKLLNGYIRYLNSQKR
jgi:four helix bundle protein